MKHGTGYQRLGPPGDGKGKQSHQHTYEKRAKVRTSGTSLLTTPNHPESMLVLDKGPRCAVQTLTDEVRGVSLPAVAVLQSGRKCHEHMGTTVFQIGR